MHQKREKGKCIEKEKGEALIKLQKYQKSHVFEEVTYSKKLFRPKQGS